MWKRIRATWAELNEPIYTGERLKNNLRALTVISLFCVLLGIVMIVLNAVQHNGIVILSSIAFVVGGTVSAISSGIYRNRRISCISATLCCAVIFTYYAVCGVAHGFAIIWAMAMPIGLAYFVGVKYGVYLCAYYELLLIVLFYTPLRSVMAQFYSDTVMTRYPIVFFTVAGFALIGGVLAAYIKAQKTGIGERVTASLLHTSIFAQSVMIMSEQYPQYGESFPISYKKLNNPFNSSFRTADDRYFQTCVPPFNLFYPKYMAAIGREDLAGSTRYLIESISENDLYEEFTEILEEAFAKKTAAEWDRIFTEEDIPHSICLTYKELLTDPQVEAIGVFQKMNYPGNPDIKVARQPVSIGGELADFGRGPLLGEHSEEVLRELGYTDAELAEMHSAGVYNTWDDLKEKLNG